MASNHFFERVEISFESRDSRIHSRKIDYWYEVFSESFGPIISRFRGTHIDSVVFQDAAVFIYANRLVVFGSSSTWLVKLLKVLRRMSGYNLESLVYQLRGFPEPNPTEMRRRLGLIRAEVGVRLGAAVVFEDTALVHPIQRKIKQFSENTCMQLIMKKVEVQFENFRNSTAETDDKPSFLKRSFQKILKDFEFFEVRNADRYTLSGICGNEYFTLQVFRSKLGSSAIFEFSGATREGAVRMGERILHMLNPENHKVTALHMGSKSLPFLMGRRWQSQPLGLTDTLSILSPIIERQGAHATA